MSVVSTKPLLKVWIQGTPQSGQKKGSNSNYVERIRMAAREEIDKPLLSHGIDVEILFAAPGISRPDVDNVIKPVLDAFIGVVYNDDIQVRSVRAVAIPSNEMFSFSGPANVKDIQRLLNQEEFLVAVFEGRRLARGSI